MSRRNPDTRRSGCPLCGATQRPLFAALTDCAACRSKSGDGRTAAPTAVELVRLDQLQAEVDRRALYLQQQSAEGQGIRVALVGCGKDKERGEHPARQLYKGPLFRKAYAYAQTWTDHREVWILSAKYGLLDPARLIPWYDERLPQAIMDRHYWSMGVASALRTQYPAPLRVHVQLLAGADYVEGVARLLPKDWTVELPLQSLQLGERLSWFSKHTPVRD